MLTAQHALYKCYDDMSALQAALQQLPCAEHSHVRDKEVWS